MFYLFVVLWYYYSDGGGGECCVVPDIYSLLISGWHLCFLYLLCLFTLYGIWRFTLTVSKCSLQNCLSTAVNEVELAPLESAVPAADASWKTKANTHTQGRQTAQFSVQYVLCHAVAKPCSQQLFNKQSYKNLHTCQSCFWCSAAWRHDWTPHHIFLQKYAEPLIGRTCSPKLQGKKYCVYIFFSVCGANLTAAANLRLIIPLILQWVPPSLFHSWLCSPPSAAQQLCSSLCAVLKGILDTPVF